MGKTYRGFAVLLGEDGRWHACVAGHSMFSAADRLALIPAIDRHYMSLPDSKAALAAAQIKDCE